MAFLRPDSVEERSDAGMSKIIALDFCAPIDSRGSRSVNKGKTPQKVTAIADVVLDTSVVVKWFVPENYSAEALRFLSSGYRRHIPVPLQSEFVQTIWKKVYQRKEIVAADGRSILGALLATPFEIHDVAPLLEPAYDIAVATGRTVDDSVYLALAVDLGCTFMTADQQLYNALRATSFASELTWVAEAI
jgi:predicted nucleic acid-binding protein